MKLKENNMITHIIRRLMVNIIKNLNRITLTNNQKANIIITTNTNNLILIILHSLNLS